MKPVKALLIFAICWILGAFAIGYIASILVPSTILTLDAKSDYTDQSLKASHARYFNARNGLDRSWGPWTAMVYSRDGRIGMIQGIDTLKRCESFRKAYEAEADKEAPNTYWVLAKAKVVCFESAAAMMTRGTK